MNLESINSDGTVSAMAVPLTEVIRSVIASTVGMYSRVGWKPPWIAYFAFEGGECVGTCAFTRAPKDGVVEIAYFTLPGHEGRGVATRMAERLVSMARKSAPEVTVTAHTLPQENASTRILRKTGFAFAGPKVHAEDGLIWVWRYDGTKEPTEFLSPGRPGLDSS